MARLRVGVLVSGFGSNLQALIDLCAPSDFPAEIVGVVSNEPGAAALDRARHAGIPAHVVPHRDFADRAGFEAALGACLAADRVEFVCLAGFMRILTAGFTEAWRDRMLNIHPSLLPAFTGLHTHRRALAAGVRLHGCTVHFVRAELDNGPILVQAAVPVLETDDEASLAARVLAAEHRAYPLALRLVAEGKVRIEGDRVRVEDARPATETGLLNPADLPFRDA
jgi:phosphoribosylglycinamide formyltransferase-1